MDVRETAKETKCRETMHNVENKTNTNTKKK